MSTTPTETAILGDYNGERLETLVDRIRVIVENGDPSFAAGDAYLDQAADIAFQAYVETRAQQLLGEPVSAAAFIIACAIAAGTTVKPVMLALTEEMRDGMNAWAERLRPPLPPAPTDPRLSAALRAAEVAATRAFLKYYPREELNGRTDPATMQRTVDRAYRVRDAVVRALATTVDAKDSRAHLEAVASLHDAVIC
jgi:hypothetical protein